MQKVLEDTQKVTKKYSLLNIITVGFIKVRTLGHIYIKKKKKALNRLY